MISSPSCQLRSRKLFRFPQPQIKFRVDTQKLLHSIVHRFRVIVCTDFTPIFIPFTACETCFMINPDRFQIFGRHSFNIIQIFPLLTGKELLDEVVEILYLDLSLIDIHRTVKSVKHVNRQLSDDAMEVEDEESDDEGDSCKKSGHKRFWLQRIKPHLCLEELDDESADKKDVIDAHKFWDLNVASVYGLFFESSIDLGVEAGFVVEHTPAAKKDKPSRRKARLDILKQLRG
eukprot:221166_1